MGERRRVGMAAGALAALVLGFALAASPSTGETEPPVEPTPVTTAAVPPTTTAPATSEVPPTTTPTTTTAPAPPTVEGTVPPPTAPPVEGAAAEVAGPEGGAEPSPRSTPKA